MLTPYDWQEGIGHRAQFVENRLKSGIPVVAASCIDGVVLATYRRQSNKIYEIYDRLAFSAVGLQSDIENVRVAAVEFTHREGYQRSEQDVTIQRVVSSISQPVKRTFSDFSYTPLVVRALFAEVGAAPADDQFYVMDFDGDYHVKNQWAFVVGSPEGSTEIENLAKEIDWSCLAVDQAFARMFELLDGAMGAQENQDEGWKDDLVPEKVLLARAPTGLSRFARMV
jgi:proteasome alpha subunit